MAKMGFTFWSKMLLVLAFFQSQFSQNKAYS